MKLCDLHTHSTFSDGTYTPEEIIDLAVKTGLGAVALTDHNTVSGLESFISYAKDKTVSAVPGLEISTDYNGIEFHILGLFITPNMFAQINDYLKTASDRKEKSNILLVERLNDNGYKIDYEKIKKSSPSGKINRANIAAELCSLGYVESVKEAFSTILSPGYGFYEQPERLSALDTTAFLKSIGSVPVWAHPLISTERSICVEFLPAAKDRGLAGIETVYSLYSEADSEFAKRMCAKYGLIESGGSDFHGDIKPDISLGSGKGNLEIPFTFYEKLAVISKM
ncbi:MAG: PHP domain-containing protein [Clostridia bacterium]|nr:PHP domain-containing protein [Clostridia bacterium]